MLTRLKYQGNNIHEPGTARVAGEEVYPATYSFVLREFDEDTAQVFKDEERITLDPSHKHAKDLRPYQLEDLEFLVPRNNVGIFNEQRTGKTPTLCRMLAFKEVKKVLIVAPSSMLLVWQREYERWNGGKAIVAKGTPKQKQDAIDQWEEALIISYDSLKEVKRGDKVYGMLKPILKHKDIEAVVLDEAHRISNYRTAQAKAAFAFRNVPIKVALTGTPATNRSHHIFGILRFLHPKIFSSFWRFMDYYYVVPDRYIGRGQKVKDRDGAYFKPGKEQELQEWLDTISIQRKRREVMPWLPEKDYLDIELDPNKQQSKYIDELRNYFETEDVIAVNTLDALIKERMIALSPLLVGLKGGSPKLEWLKEYLKDYPDKPILIFSKFTKWLDMLSEELDIPAITGKVSLDDRLRICDDFQQGKINRVLINIDAGKEGLTLDRAEVSIFTDKYPPVGSIEQAEDRFVATTEDKKDKEHLLINLILRESYEENIQKMIAEGLEEIDVINDYKKYLRREE